MPALKTLPTVFAPKQGSNAVRAGKVLDYGLQSCESMLALYDAWSSVSKKRGVKSHDQQDLLRAMVVFAGAALDSSLKHLVRDALPTLLDAGDDAVKKAFEGYAQNRLADQPKQMARLLTLDSPRAGLLEDLVDERTRNSLQSRRQLSEVAGYFGVVSSVGFTEKQVEPAFECRNRIAHELDVNFGSTTRTNRRQHARDDLVEHSSKMLMVASNIIQAVDKKLP